VVYIHYSLWTQLITSPPDIQHTTQFFTVSDKNRALLYYIIT